jgi:CHAT domain-containing protein
MKESVLTLDVSRQERRLKVSFFEEDDKALHPYEINEVAWEQVESASREILATLRRSNRRVKIDPEVHHSLKKSGQILFDLLIPAHTKEKFAHTDAKVLTLRLDDTLVQLPWELLHDGEAFLCRRFAIGRIARTRQRPTARSVRTPSAPFTILIIADPRGDLEASYREGLDIKAFLDARRNLFHVDFKSHPVDIAFARKNLRDYDIVHYAGHADYDGQDPSESGWLLSDGALKAAEIAAMGGIEPMPALVFSNACQSGQTDEWSARADYGQRIAGLANAFLLAGVQHYIGTFSEALDEPSSRFAKRFYAAVAEGESVGTALRTARQAAINAGGDETVAWANYMLYGDPSRKFGLAEGAGALGRARKGWRRFSITRIPPGRSGERISATRLFVSLIGVLILAALYSGFSFYSASSKKSENPPIQAAARSETSAPMIPAEAVAQPLTLSMNIIGQRKEPDASYTEVIVREGSVLRSNDHFQVHLETNRPSHVYILLFDSQGQASQLFPDPKIEQPGFIERGHKIAIPDKDLWFWLDEQPGTETVYVLASEEPMSDVRGLLGKIAKASEAERKRLSGEIKQRIGIVERGVGGVAKGKTVSYALSDGRTIQKVTDVVAGSGAVVRAISFEHR